LVSSPPVPTSVIYTGAFAVTVGLPAILSAKLTDANNGSPLAFKPVSLTLGAGATAQTCSSLTDSFGAVNCTIVTVSQPLGSGTVSIVFPGDASSLPSSGAAAVLIGPPTSTSPTCVVSGVIQGPPKQIQITVQDTGSGLQRIAVITSTNASIPVPSFNVGTTDPVTVTATKTDQTKGAEVALQITNAAGNVTNCDPVIAAEVPVAKAIGGGCSQGSTGLEGLLFLALAGLLRRRRVFG
jgi:uncharacterized protein (TIGR03382 family)